MKYKRLYKVDCMLLYNEELICDVIPNTEGLNNWRTSLKETIKVFESIKFEDFDRKEVYMARLKGLGNTYNKTILACDMPEFLYNECLKSDDGVEYTVQEKLEYLSECVFSFDCIWKDNLKDELFEVGINSIENLREYKEDLE